MFHGKIHYKWPFSIAMLVYQRVSLMVFGGSPFLCKRAVASIHTSSAQPGHSSQTLRGVLCPWLLVSTSKTRLLKYPVAVNYGESMDWFKGKSTGNHGFYHQIKGFPVNVPIIQFYEWIILLFFGYYYQINFWFQTISWPEPYAAETPLQNTLNKWCFPACLLTRGEVIGDNHPR